MLSETVYLGHSNSIDMLMIANGEIYDLVNVVRMTLEFKDTVIDSDISPDAFDWSEGEGVVYLMMGAESIPLGAYKAVLTMYDNVNTDGIVWDSFRVWVK